jgi:hypothetical protein
VYLTNLASLTLITVSKYLYPPKSWVPNVTEAIEFLSLSSQPPPYLEISLLSPLIFGIDTASGTFVLACLTRLACFCVVPQGLEREMGDGYRRRDDNGTNLQPRDWRRQGTLKAYRRFKLCSSIGGSTCVKIHEACIHHLDFPIVYAGTCKVKNMFC